MNSQLLTAIIKEAIIYAGLYRIYGTEPVAYHTASSDSYTVLLGQRRVEIPSRVMTTREGFLDYLWTLLREEAMFNGLSPQVVWC